MKKIIVIVGPTGVGKTETSIVLAQKFGGEIINADSRQFYSELKIGTMRPTDEQFQKVPHHLFGISPLTSPWDAARFQEEGMKLIEEIDHRKHLPFVVGGTGLYIRSLLFGIFKGVKASPSLRKKLEERVKKEGLDSLYTELQKVDPRAVKKIHSHDFSRILRALEVYYETGTPISNHQNKHSFQDIKYDYLKIGINLDRKKLYQRIEKRVEEMVAQGLEEEVRKLMQKYGEAPLLLRSIGYREWFPYFTGKVKREEVISLVKQHTRNFAKRQLTWFRKEKDIFWFEAGDLSGMEERIQEFI